MASQLYHRAGFGWLSVTLLLLAAWAVTRAGWPRVVGAVIALPVATYMFLQYRKWNTVPWGRIHYRAMLAYARIWGAEVTAAEVSHRQPSVSRAWERLYAEYHTLSTDEDIAASLVELKAYNDSRLIGLIEEHSHLVRDFARSRDGLAATLRAFDFAPQLVISLLVEDYYGREEAAKYALALATGEAR